MASVYDVASYFLLKDGESEDSGISNLKLQKLVYYAQGFHLALFDRPLFNERIEAWMHGPVCPDLYQKYKTFGRDPISEDEFDVAKNLSAEEVELLDEVSEVFGQFSAWKLRNLTHDEPPWIENERTASTISQQSMQQYFKTLLN